MMRKYELFRIQPARYADAHQALPHPSPTPALSPGPLSLLATQKEVKPLGTAVAVRGASSFVLLIVCTGTKYEYSY